MSCPHLREARPTDAGAVGAILSSFTDATPWMPRIHSRAEDLSFAGRMIDRNWVQVAVRDDGVCGFLARDGAEILALYVRSDARSQGVGAALIRQAQAVRDRLELATFQANLGAQRFYRAQGFVETRRSDGAHNDEGLPDVSFRWTATRHQDEGARG